MMKEKINDTELEIKQIEREIERGCDNAIKYFGLFVAFFVAGLLLWLGMHAIFSAGIDSWKTDPELNNVRDMWKILMHAIPYTLYALAAGFLVTYFLSPMYVIFGNIMIFLLKRRMRRENSFREGNNDASH